MVKTSSRNRFSCHSYAIYLSIRFVKMKPDFIFPRRTSFPLNRVHPPQCSSHDPPHLHATLDFSGEFSL